MRGLNVEGGNIDKTCDIIKIISRLKEDIGFLKHFDFRPNASPDEIKSTQEFRNKYKACYDCIHKFETETGLSFSYVHRAESISNFADFAFADDDNHVGEKISLLENLLDIIKTIDPELELVYRREDNVPNTTWLQIQDQFYQGGEDFPTFDEFMQRPYFNDLNLTDLQKSTIFEAVHQYLSHSSHRYRVLEKDMTVDKLSEALAKKVQREPDFINRLIYLYDDNYRDIRLALEEYLYQPTKSSKFTV